MNANGLAWSARRFVYLCCLCFDRRASRFSTDRQEDYGRGGAGRGRCDFGWVRVADMMNANMPPFDNKKPDKRNGVGLELTVQCLSAAKVNMPGIRRAGAARRGHGGEVNGFPRGRARLLADTLLVSPWEGW